MMKKRSVSLSVPEPRKVRGYVIKRLPLGGYLRMTEKLAGASEEIIRACFPGKSATELLKEMQTITDKGALTLLSRLLTTAPTYLLELVADLTDIPYDDLLEDQNIGVDGLMEILRAFWEVNDLKNVKAAMTAFLPQAINNGSRASSPQD